MTDAPRSAAIYLIVVCFASVALADDFKTIEGKEYKNATVSRVEPDGIVLTTKTGISKVYFTELLKEVQQHFHYDAAQAAQFTAATQTAISQSNAAIAAEQQAAAAEQNRKKKLWHREQAAAQQRHAEIQRQEEAQQPSAGRAEAANALASAKRRVNSLLGESHPQQSNAAAGAAAAK
jgi:CRISPR/Cas system-associated endonuclease Cas1